MKKNRVVGDLVMGYGTVVCSFKRDMVMTSMIGTRCGLFRRWLHSDDDEDGGWFGLHADKTTSVGMDGCCIFLCSTNWLHGIHVKMECVKCMK